MHKDMKLKDVSVSGDKLTITKDAIELRIEAGIATQIEYKQNSDLSGWLMTAGYIEALKDMLACFEG